VSDQLIIRLSYQRLQFNVYIKGQDDDDDDEEMEAMVVTCYKTLPQRLLERNR
jgi:hypothetical protein